MAHSIGYYGFATATPNFIICVQKSKPPNEVIQSM